MALVGASPSRLASPSLPSPPAPLTHDGQDDDHKVEDVPADGEVVVPQGEHFEHTLTGEEDDEDQVNPVEDVLHLLALRVRLHHHRHHVKADEHHDNNVKGLLRDKVKDDALDFVLVGGWGARGRKDTKGFVNAFPRGLWQLPTCASKCSAFLPVMLASVTLLLSGYQEHGQTPSRSPHREFSKIATLLFCVYAITHF